MISTCRIGTASESQPLDQVLVMAQNSFAIEMAQGRNPIASGKDERCQRWLTLRRSVLPPSDGRTPDLACVILSGPPAANLAFIDRLARRRQ